MQARGGAPCVLFLQGPPSGFARALGAELRRRGCRVLRVNLCAGDRIFWPGPEARSYRGSLAAWPGWLDRLMLAEGVTDLLYFGDQQPYHRAARPLAEARGIRVLAYEYGYLRPDWIVAEPGGQSAFSRLCTDPERLRAAAQGLADPDLTQRYPLDARREARGDVIYHLANYLLAPLYPRFRRDRVFNPVLEYLSYLPRHARARRGAGEARNLAARLAGGGPVFLALLQMQNDYQIRANSPYRDQRRYLAELATSFAAHAPPGAHLVVKLHPHDNGLTPWRRCLARLRRRHGLGGRLHLLDGGRIEDWARRARGVITINSTAGLTALICACPVLARGVAIYDLPGLTHQAGLDRFWCAPEGPDPARLRDVLRVLAHHLHVRGGFYGGPGQAAAIAALADRIVAAAPLPPVFDPAPPRLARARALGVPMDA